MVYYTFYIWSALPSYWGGILHYTVSDLLLLKPNPLRYCRVISFVASPFLVFIPGNLFTVPLMHNISHCH